MSVQFDLDAVETVDPATLEGLEDNFDDCEEGENLDELVGVFAFGTTSRHVLATWLPAAFKKWSVKYRLVDGWETRGRPLSVGYFDPNGLLTHHTGSTSSATNPRPSLSTLINGRTGLRGPLCQIATDYNGITDIVAAGRANHAGEAKAAMGNPAGDGNAMYLGNEVQTNGTQKMPDVQYQAIVLVSAAILDHFGYKDASKLGLHHTTSKSGKWDLGAGTGTFGVPYSITKFRADVTARLKAGPPVGPTLNRGDRGTPVTELQKLLVKLGQKIAVDGSFGPATEAAVKAVQTKLGLAATGVVTDAVMAAIKAAVAALPSAPAPAPAPVPVKLAPYPGHVHKSTSRDDSHVGLIQKRLKALGHYKLAIDSKFGAGTRAAVIAFQKAQKISADGVVGPTTWARLKIPA